MTALGDIAGGREGLSERVRTCHERIAAAARRSGRDPSIVRLLCVTKYVDEDVIRALWSLGERDFGENRAQVLTAKAACFASLEGARVHFIGHLQRNKVRTVLPLVTAIQSIDSARLLDEIATRVAPDALRQAPCPELWLEVNISDEEQKTGLEPGAVRELARHARSVDAVRGSIAGLMGMAAYDDDPETARPAFRRLRELRDALIGEGLLRADAGLSMGMSSDFEVAVEEGATEVRIGSWLFEG